MGWRGTLRSINASMKRADRAARRRQRELERRQKEYQKMVELEQAAHYVAVYENYVARLISVHKSYSQPIDWQKQLEAPAPAEPVQTHEKEQTARRKRDGYRPGLITRWLDREEKVRNKLEKKLEKAIEKDEQAYERLMETYKTDYENWQDEHQFAKRLFSGDQETYDNVMEEMKPFREIAEFGSGITVETENGHLYGRVKVRGEIVVPQEVKALLRSGRLTVKKMPKGQFYELYQDYVCSVLFRIAAECFALTPTESVVVTAKDDILNTTNGHWEEVPIVSAFIPREKFERLNLQNIDPSDALCNFVHNMSFKKTKGFAPVEEIAPVGVNGL